MYALTNQVVLQFERFYVAIKPEMWAFNFINCIRFGTEVIKERLR
jgi:hypothetical protein